MYKDYLILGGAGLVGLQVCRNIVRRLDPLESSSRRSLSTRLRLL